MSVTVSEASVAHVKSQCGVTAVKNCSNGPRWPQTFTHTREHAADW